MRNRRLFRFLTTYAALDLSPLSYHGAVIGNDQTDYNDVVVVAFNRAIDSPGADYSAGVTIEVNAVGATISSADLQADAKSVYYTLSAAVDANDTVTWAYDSGTGDIEDAADSSITLGDVTAQNVPNYIGTQYWFQHSENSGHLATLGV